MANFKMTCNNCEKVFDCVSPCKKAIAWQPLEDKFYQKNYRAQGIGYLDPFGHRAREARGIGSGRGNGGRDKKEITRY